MPTTTPFRFNGHRQEPHIWLDKTPGWHIWWTIVGLLSPPQCNCASPECLPGWADHHNSVQALTCGTGLIEIQNKTRRYFFVIGWEVGLLNWISGVLPKKNPRCICTSSECWPKCADYQNLVHALTCSKGLEYIQVIFSHWVYSLELCESNIFMGAVKFRVFSHEQFPLHCTLSKYNQ